MSNTQRCQVFIYFQESDAFVQENDDIYLLSEVASLYYEENYTQERIAKVIGISRSSISRLLTRSRELGLVNIHVHHSLPTSANLREELIQRFGLENAGVLNSSSEELALSQVGSLAARYIDRQIQEHHMESKPVRTIGTSWGTSLLAMLKALRPMRQLPLSVVQLVGSIDSATRPEINGPEIARRLAEAYDARCFYLHAPLLVASAAVRDGLLKDRSLCRTFQVMEQLDIAIVGIGGARQDASGLTRTGSLSEHEVTHILSQGAVGDMCGYYFDIDGLLCATTLLSRTIAIPFETLHKIPHVVAIASGAVKAEAVLGALRTGIVKVLMTDDRCAQALLQLAKGKAMNLSG